MATNLPFNPINWHNINNDIYDPNNNIYYPPSYQEQITNQEPTYQEQINNLRKRIEILEKKLQESTKEETIKNNQIDNAIDNLEL